MQRSGEPGYLALTSAGSAGADVPYSAERLRDFVWSCG